MKLSFEPVEPDEPDIIKIIVSNPYKNQEMARDVIANIEFKSIRITDSQISLSVVAEAFSSIRFHNLICKLLYFETGLLEVPDKLDLEKMIVGI